MQRDIRTLRASVTQEKRVTALKKTIHSQGTIVLAKPNLLRWEVSGAERSVTVVDGETMTVYHPATNEAQVYALSENVAARATMAIFASALTGALQEMEKRFAVKIFRRERAIVFQLVPLSRIAGRYLSTILICYDEQSGLPQEFEITTGKGDRALTKLTDIEVNPSLQPHTFELKLPADVWITNRFQDNSN